MDLLFGAIFWDCSGNICRHRLQSAFMLAISFMGMSELVPAVVENIGNAKCLSRSLGNHRVHQQLTTYRLWPTNEAGWVWKGNFIADHIYMTSIIIGTCYTGIVNSFENGCHDIHWFWKIIKHSWTVTRSCISTSDAKQGCRTIFCIQWVGLAINTLSNVIICIVIDPNILKFGVFQWLCPWHTTLSFINDHLKGATAIDIVLQDHPVLLSYFIRSNSS